MPRRVGIEVVGVNLEWYEAQRVEIVRFRDGDVVRGADGGSRHVGPRAPADVSRAAVYFCSYGLEEVIVLH